jgi:diaminopimelate epimerase
MRLSKWHGLGNDYLLVERGELAVPLTSERVRRLCDYHFGVGSDGTRSGHARSQRVCAAAPRSSSRSAPSR